MKLQRFHLWLFAATVLYAGTMNSIGYAAMLPTVAGPQ
jgi:hypothetical protein